MEDRIEFEEETIVEEVFSGEIDINEKRSSKQEKTHAFEIFKKATSQNINKSEYKIEWLDEDFESNTKHFRVLHTYKKKVPYRISYEEIYKGEYYLTGETISPEERRSQIFNLFSIIVSTDSSTSFVFSDNSSSFSPFGPFANSSLKAIIS